MKVGSIGNMAGDGLLTTMALRKVGVDAELIVNSHDFACAHPWWELKDFGRNLFDNEVDPYTLRLDDINYKLPDWINILNLSVIYSYKKNKKSLLKSVYKLSQNKPFIHRLKTMIVFTALHYRVTKVIKKYDIIEAHVPYALNLYLTSKPYIIYEAGWMATLTDKHYNKSWITKKSVFASYRKAKGIINTNPYIHNMFIDNPLNNNLNFIPFAVDTDRYTPLKCDDIKEQLTKNNEYLILGMARQNWIVKGSDRLIKAFYMFNKTYPRSRLLLMKWGINLEKSIELIKTLGISKQVSWLPFMPKSKLILIYNAVDIACDQFILGGWGTSYPECLATGTPVLLYHKNIDTERFFGSLPPTPSVETVKDIYKALLIYYKKNNPYSGQDCRDWIVSTHGMSKIGNMHKKVLEDALNG